MLAKSSHCHAHSPLGVCYLLIILFNLTYPIYHRIIFFCLSVATILFNADRLTLVVIKSITNQ
jgi:hypothetical protein